MPMRRIMHAARRARLDFLGLTDHHDQRAAKDPSVLAETKMHVLVGVEVNDPRAENHYLVFGDDDIMQKREAAEYVEHYHRRGATGFMAHPRERRVGNKYPMYPWTAGLLENVDGIEVWNYISSWLGSLSLIFNAAILVFLPMFFVRRPLRENLDLWDEMNRRSWRKAAIGSVDAHAHRRSFLGIKFRVLPHCYLFRTIRTNVLLYEDETAGNEAILCALREGRSYIINYQIGHPHNFWAGVWSPEGQSACFGEEICFADGMRYYYNLPSRASVSLFRDGVRIDRQTGENGFFVLDRPGAYRLEIRRWLYGWIYTNNIWVVPDEQALERGNESTEQSQRQDGQAQ